MCVCVCVCVCVCSLSVYPLPIVLLFSGPGNLDNWDPMMDDFTSPTFNTYDKGPGAHLPQPRAPEIKL